VQPARVPGGWRWNPWPALRWGATAAVLGALALVVVLHPNMYKHPEVAREKSSPAPAGNVANAPQSVAALPSAPPAKTAQVNVPVEKRESTRQIGALAGASGPMENFKLQDNEELSKAKKQVTLLDAVRSPAAVRADNIPSPKNEKHERKEGDALTAKIAPPPPPPAAPAAKPVGASDEAGRVSADSHSAPAALHSAALGGAGTASGEPLPAPAPSVAAEESNTGVGRGQAAAAKSAQRGAAMGSFGLGARASMSEMRASHKDKGIEAGSPATRWTVSSEGQVQRSMDAGKTLEQIQVGHGTKFLTVAALGTDVWAGGTGGALYHSVDGGATWNRASINVEGTAVTESIMEIQLSAAQHLTVTTASGAQWASEDGSLHWQKKP